ncbi:MAG: hypothetical protein SNJ71_03990, partial [Bacteroidales bacterium]
METNKHTKYYTIQDFQKYFAKKSTDSEQYEFEKNLLVDPFFRDTYDGLSSLHPDIIEVDVEKILTEYENKYKIPFITSLFQNIIFRIIAGLLLLIVFSIIFYLTTNNRTSPQKNMPLEVTVKKIQKPTNQKIKTPEIPIPIKQYNSYFT